MYRAWSKEHLAQVERHIARADTILIRQREIIAELEHDGHDATRARQLLTLFEEVLALHVAHRDRLRDEQASGGLIERR